MAALAGDIAECRVVEGEVASSPPGTPKTMMNALQLPLPQGSDIQVPGLDVPSVAHDTSAAQDASLFQNVPQTIAMQKPLSGHRSRRRWRPTRWFPYGGTECSSFHCMIWAVMWRRPCCHPQPVGCPLCLPCPRHSFDFGFQAPLCASGCNAIPKRRGPKPLPLAMRNERFCCFGCGCIVDLLIF